MYRSDSTSLQEEIKKKNSIISDYKLIVSQLSKRIEEVQRNSQVKYFILRGVEIKSILIIFSNMIVQKIVGFL